MFDFYSIIPLPVVYFIGGILLVIIAWSMLRDTVRAKPQDRKKLVTIYASVLFGSVILAFCISYFRVPERLFPSFYEREAVRQEQLKKNIPWEENFNWEKWEVPFQED